MEHTPHCGHEIGLSKSGRMVCSLMEIRPTSESNSSRHFLHWKLMTVTLLLGFAFALLGDSAVPEYPIGAAVISCVCLRHPDGELIGAWSLDPCLAR
jgi:hypothetical protein